MGIYNQRDTHRNWSMYTRTHKCTYTHTHTHTHTHTATTWDVRWFLWWWRAFTPRGSGQPSWLPLPAAQGGSYICTSTQYPARTSMILYRYVSCVYVHMCTCMQFCMYWRFVLISLCAQTCIRLYMKLFIVHLRGFPVNTHAHARMLVHAGGWCASQPPSPWRASWQQWRASWQKGSFPQSLPTPSWLESLDSFWAPTHTTLPHLLEPSPVDSCDSNKRVSGPFCLPGAIRV